MTSVTLQVYCLVSDFPVVESKLQEWDEVEAVGSIRDKSNGKSNKTTVFIKFTSDEAKTKALAKLKTIPQIIRESEKKDDTKTAEGDKTNKAAKKEKKKNYAAEFFTFDATVQAQAQQQQQQKSAGRQGRGGGGRGGRGGRGSRAGRGGEGAPEGQSADHRRGGRGGRGGRHGGRGNGHHQGGQQQPNEVQSTAAGGRGGFHNRKNNHRGNHNRRFRNNFQQLPPTELYVAYVDNVPFGTPNKRLMELFEPYGHVVDINRCELMAMVSYQNPEDVQKCIQGVNGTKIGENTVTVSSGTMRVPGVAAQYFGL